MIDRFIGVVETLIQTHGMLGVFLAGMIEEIIAPIPSGLVMMSAGYAFFSGETLNVANLGYLFITVALPLAIGLTMGSLVVYGLTYVYGEKLIRRFGKYFFINWSDVEKLRQKFKQGYKDEIVLFILRLLPVIPSVALNTIAGVLKIKPMHYLVATFLGTLIRGFVVSLIGWQVGNVYKEYALQIDHYENYAFGLVLAFVIGYLLWKQYGKKKVVV